MCSYRWVLSAAKHCRNKRDRYRSTPTRALNHLFMPCTAELTYFLYKVTQSHMCIHKDMHCILVQCMSQVILIQIGASICMFESFLCCNSIIKTSMNFFSCTLQTPPKTFYTEQQKFTLNISSIGVTVTSIGVTVTNTVTRWHQWKVRLWVL